MAIAAGLVAVAFALFSLALCVAAIRQSGAGARVDDGADLALDPFPQTAVVDGRAKAQADADRPFGVMDYDDINNFI